VHGLIAERLQEIQYTGSQQDEFTEALEIVWRQKQQDKLQGVNALQKRLDELQRTKSKLVVEMVKADPKYKADIEQGVDGVKANIASIEDKISSLNKLDDDLAEFLKFGLDYTTNLVEDWWELEHEDRVRCQQLVFPGGISFNADKKVGTSQLSALYSLKPNKKDLRNDRKSLLEELIQDNWHPIELELGHWREVLAIPWMRAKNNYVP
jgi:DNA repair exonuclease SbcCD ATPase subunit